MRDLNQALGKIREELELHEVSKEPVQRAKDRMAAAWKRGGFQKLITATKVRINATKNPGKLQGIKLAIKEIIKDDHYPLTPSQEAELYDLINSI